MSAEGNSGRADGQADGQVDGQVDGKSGTKTDEQARSKTDERARSKTDEQTGETSDEQTGESAGVRNAPTDGAEPVVRGARGGDGGRPEGGASAEPGGPDSQSDGEGDDGELLVVDPVSAPDAEGHPRRATRRFPLFTRDTARPEGGGRAAPRDAPMTARQWPILVVLSMVALGLLLTAFDVFRYGTILIGVALLGGAVLRWTLPDVGMLAVRSRFTDLVTYGVLGVAIVLLALMAQPNPLLEIPFLDDTLHFTVR